MKQDEYFTVIVLELEVVGLWVEEDWWVLGLGLFLLHLWLLLVVVVLVFSFVLGLLWCCGVALLDVEDIL